MELKLSATVTERSLGATGERTFAKGYGGQNVREGTFAKGDGGENVREGTFAKGDGGQNVREGMFAKGDLQGYRIIAFLLRPVLVLLLEVNLCHFDIVNFKDSHCLHMR